MQNSSPLSNNRKKEETSFRLPTYSYSGLEHSAGFDVQNFLQILGRRWWVIVGLGSLVFAIQIYKAWQKPPVYREQFQLLVQPPEQDITNPLDMAGQVFAGNATRDNIDTQITILRSNRLLKPVLEKIYKQYPELSADNFPLSSLVNRMTIQQIDKSEILTISYQDSDPQRVKFVLDALANTYLAYTLKDQQLRTREKLFFVNQQVPALKRRVEEIEQKLLDLRKKNKFFEPQIQGTALNETLNRVTEQQQEVNSQLEQKHLLATALKQQLGPAEKQAIALEALSQSTEYRQLLTRLNEIDMQLARNSTRFTDSTNLIKELKEEREKLTPLLKRQSQGIIGTLPNGISKMAPNVLAPNNIRSDSIKQLLEVNNQVLALQLQQQILSAYKQQLTTQLQNFSGIVTQYSDLQRQLTLATESLNRLLAAGETLEIEMARRFIPWRLVAEPQLPTVPIDRFWNDVLFALLQATVVGGMAGGLVEVLDRRYHSPDDIGKDLSVSVLGVIPHLANLKRLKIWNRDKFTKKNIEVNFLEAFSVLFSSLFFLRQKQQCRSFIVSSATLGDGKSTVSFFTALAAAKLGQKTLLIDGDRYFPQGENWLAFITVLSSQKPPENGLTLPSRQDLERTERPVTLAPNLDYFKTPNNALDPDQLLSEQSLLVLLAQWQDLYDVILIDTPPVLGLSDSRLIASQTDGVLLVVRLEKTSKDAVHKTIEALDLANLSLLGIVANNFRKSSGGYDYNYYHYYNRYYQKKAQENLFSLESRTADKS